MGDHRDAGGPEARVRLGAWNLRRKFGWKGAVNEGKMRAHLLEQAPAQHGHPAAAAGLAAWVGALPGLDCEPARRTIRANARKLALERLHRGYDPLLQSLEPVARVSEARVFG